MKDNDCPGCSFCKPHPSIRFEGSPGCLVFLALPLLWWLL